MRGLAERQGRRQKAQGTTPPVAREVRILWRLATALLLTAGCGPGGAPGPVAIDMGRDACRHCRMAIVSAATAAEIVSPGEEPLFFDDIGCLRDFVAAAPVARDAVVFVADHRTAAWVDARQAVFTKTTLQTPMGSGLVAHADTISREQDPAARGGATVSIESILR
jgi:copper chaperone NosL